MIIAFTGTRQGMDERQQRQFCHVLDWFCQMVDGSDEELEFHHGAADGADTEAARMAARTMLGPELVVARHPAGHDPLARNREMVALCDVLIAAPAGHHEVLRSGTWATIRYARRAHKPIIMLSRGAT